jgi:hypothetical protein
MPSIKASTMGEYLNLHEGARGEENLELPKGDTMFAFLTTLQNQPFSF